MKLLVLISVLVILLVQDQCEWVALSSQVTRITRTSRTSRTTGNKDEYNKDVQEHKGNNDLQDQKDPKVRILLTVSSLGEKLFY